MNHPHTSWAPEADLAEQLAGATPEAAGATNVPDALALEHADVADVLEQASVLTFLDEDDYREAEPDDRPT